MNVEPGVLSAATSSEDPDFTIPLQTQSLVRSLAFNGDPVAEPVLPAVAIYATMVSRRSSRRQLNFGVDEFSRNDLVSAGLAAFATLSTAPAAPVPIPAAGTLLVGSLAALAHVQRAVGDRLTSEQQCAQVSLA
ncbi:MAG: hypothetical protein AAGH83_11040 [Pseudomonadota bacterium]